MSYFVIIRGPLGVGKSTISQKLADKLGGRYVSIDKLLEDNKLDRMPPDAECIPAENFIKVDDMILPSASETLKQGKPVVFDACFYHKEHVQHLIDNLPFKHFVFTLKASLETCIDRDSKRSKTHGKDAACAVHYLVSRFDHGTIISTDGKTEEETLEEVLKHIKL